MRKILQSAKLVIIPNLLNNLPVSNPSFKLFLKYLFNLNLKCLKIAGLIVKREDYQLD